MSRTAPSRNLLGSLALAFLAAVLLAGCSKTEPPPTAAPTAHDHSHDHAHGHHHGHDHTPPHGGTAVELGREDYHLEFVRDAGAGRLKAYVLDGELENFIRIPAPSLELSVRFAGRRETLVLQPVANDATGETVGDTSLFEGQADWLKTQAEFEAELQQITIRTTTYTKVTFQFPQGHDAGAKH